MAIKSIDILNIMVFQRLTDSFHLDFCDGINVLIGENGVGKTTILKMIYAATQWSFEKVFPGETKGLEDFFSNNLKDSEALKNADCKGEYYFYRVSNGVQSLECDLSHNVLINRDDWHRLNISAVFIPTTEMLAHSKGFLAMNQKYNMPFDKTQVDIVVNASLPETREISESCQAMLEKISEAIDGTVVQEDDVFYVIKKDGRKIEFSLEAEGLRKLGLLWKLIRNGLLEKGSVLLWDEPEANLNPELYPLVVSILLELQKNGVQIFVATHSYNFAKYLEIRRLETRQVMFHNLYKGPSELSNILGTAMGIKDSDYRMDDVYSTSAYKMEDLTPNHIMMADNKLLDEVYDM